ncbi:MAG: serine--tRNA ligase [Candidatus Pacebacteria bacterium]|nr:serine--tRNA ligase [Candidatus Paceibacterota bacterium]
MLDIKILRDEPEMVKEKISLKRVKTEVVDEFLEADKKWRELVLKRDEAKAKQKILGEEKKIEEAKKIKTIIQELEPQIEELALKRDILLEKIPNLPDDSVTVGRDDSENPVLKEVGEKTKFDFEPKDYMEIAEKLNLIDTKQAGKIVGSRFGYLFNEAVLLEFGLVRLAFDTLLKEGFSPVVPPVMIREEFYRGMGRLAGDQKDERYYLKNDDLFLVGSAEHTIGPIHAGDILEEKDLPKRYVGFSTCFRREAGSYGKDTKGILRVHQFDKIEMFSFSLPEKSKEEHKFLLSMQEELVLKLKLPYRVVEICTGDMGWTDAKAYDVETWMPSQNKYRETNSCSNTTDFQSRGISARYKKADGSGVEYLHMLNATGFAIGRMIIAIIENYQTKDGFVKVPEVLQPYVGKEIISR